MLIAKINVYGDEELLVNSSKNRIAILEKTDMQKRFEKWLSQTRSHQDYLNKKPAPSITYPTEDLQMKAKKEALHIRVLEKERNDGYWIIDMGRMPHFGVDVNDLGFVLPKYR